MKQVEIKARKELSVFVESYWSCEGTFGESFSLLPDGTFNVIVARTPFLINGMKTLSSGTYLIPILKEPLRIRTKDHLVGIRYKPFALQNFSVHPNQKDLIPLEKLLGKKRILDKFYRSYRKETDLQFLMDEIEELSFDLISNRFEVNNDLREKVNYILDRKGNIRISELCSEFGVSRQAIHKLFKSRLGISAKELAGIWRLNSFFTAFKKNLSLTENSLDAGFFDQSHSINTFKNVWGLSPKNFIHQNQDMIEFEATKMIQRFSNYYDPEV